MDRFASFLIQSMQTQFTEKLPFYNFSTSKVIENIFSVTQNTNFKKMW